MVGILHHCPKTVMKMHKYSGDLKSDHLKSGNILKSRLFEGQISNGPVFKWSGFSYGFSYSPNYLKTRPNLNQTFQNPDVLIWISKSPCPGESLLNLCYQGSQDAQ